MRLIDEDILLKNLEWLDDYVLHDLKLSIDETPTVIAIPLQWIHDYMDYTFLPEGHFWVIQKMIKEWCKEHEKNI